jgi:hypothetical protein
VHWVFESKYPLARNKIETTGCNGSVGGCVGGKAYLLDYRECLHENGDKELS